MIFQQERAPSPTKHKFCLLLNYSFQNFCIGRCGSREKPTRTSDLAPPDIFTWESVRDKVFDTTINTLAHLRERERREQSNVLPKKCSTMLGKTYKIDFML